MLSYYSRREIQRQIVSTAKNREVAVKFPNGFGKRPDILQFDSDILELAKQGATSFHISEELWSDPMQLKPGLASAHLNKLRIGWDCMLDIDTNFLDYARETAELLIEALKFYDIKHYSIKFSGRSGFHIGIPFKAFPEKVNDIPVKDLFPDSVRIIASFLKNMISSHLEKRILSLNKIDEIEKFSGIPREKLISNGKFDPFSLVNIDSVAISSRHMMRAPYSINEKTNLASIPVENPKTFKISQAKPENVSTGLVFLDSSKIESPEASNLIMQAFDWYKKSKPSEAVNLQKPMQEDIPKIAIKTDFPPCINKILLGLEDGRKRSIFILLNFLRKMGWNYDEIQKLLFEWNKRNNEPLRENYILGQISWHKRSLQSILPPNCTNESYYKALCICIPDNWCSKIKNPAQYPKYKIKILNQNREKTGKKARKSRKKETFS